MFQAVVSHIVLLLKQHPIITVVLRKKRRWRERERREGERDGERQNDQVLHFCLKNLGKGMMILNRVTIKFIMRIGIFLESKVSLTRMDATMPGINLECTWGKLRCRVTLHGGGRGIS